ncbi:MAG: hypothetical protein BMS9Abin29_0455 [Gemmatimonadota bacterium]|nr:MAG: hypothetical protein BMS9Abin29_0455 [Gemmatimonadota bacterium]
MRRTIKLLSVALLLFGFEFASGTLSTTLNRFTQTLSSTVADDVPSLPPLRFAWGVGMIVIGIAGMALVLWAKHASTSLSRGQMCSHCGGRTRRLRRRMHHRVLGWMSGLELARRRCVECGWKGLAVRD